MLLLAFFVSLYAAEIKFLPGATDGKVFEYTGTDYSKTVTLKWGTGTGFSLGTTAASTAAKFTFSWAKLEEFLATMPSAAADIMMSEESVDDDVAWITSAKVLAIAQAGVEVLDATHVRVAGVTANQKYYCHEALEVTTLTPSTTNVDVPSAVLRPKTYLYEFAPGTPAKIDAIHIVTLTTASTRTAATDTTDKKKVVITDILGSNVTVPVAITGVEITDTHNSGFVKATLTVTPTFTAGAVGTGKWVYTSAAAAAELPASYKVVPCTGSAPVSSNAWSCTATAIQVGTPPAAGAKGVFASFILLIAAVLLL